MLFYVSPKAQTVLLLLISCLFRGQTQITQGVRRICQNHSNHLAGFKPLTVSARCHTFLDRTPANRAKAVTVYGLDSVNTAALTIYGLSIILIQTCLMYAACSEKPVYALCR